MPKEEWEAQQNYIKDVKPMHDHAKNDFYYGLSQEFSRHRRLPVAGYCTPGIMIPLAGLKGVAPETPLSVEVARVERDWLMSDGHLYGSDGVYLEDSCSDALIAAYLLESSLCCIRKPSGAVSLQTRSIQVMNDFMSQHRMGMSACSEDNLFENMDIQISSGDLRSFRLDQKQVLFVPDTVSVNRETVVPRFLLQRFTEWFLKGLQKRSARIAYADGQGVKFYTVSLVDSFMQHKVRMSSRLLAEMAWDRKSTEFVLPIFNALEPDRLDFKKFNVMSIREIQWFTL